MHLIKVNKIMKKRIGVFVCDCGTNIAAVVDVPAVTEHAGTLGDVVLAEEGRWICAVDYLDKLKEFVEEHSLDRVVVACCTPRTHEQIFRSALEEAGLNPNLLEFVSIREQCSWVHKSEPEEATSKAKNLVEMAVAKARLLEPAEPIRIPVGGTAMVVGGGPAGLTAAAALADNGFKVVLVERSEQLGGRLNELDVLAPSDRHASEVLEALLGRGKSNDLINIYTETELTGVTGYVGNFKAQLNKTNGTEHELDVATIILATGMQVLEPEGLCGDGKYPNVVTELEFERLLAGTSTRTDINLDDVKSIAVINCVNSRNDQRGCCFIGCLSAIKSIKTFKSTKGGSEAYLFHRDLIVPGTESDYLDESRKYTEAMVRYPDGEQHLPEVSEGSAGKLTVKAHDRFLEDDVEVEVDLVVLVSPFQGDSSAVTLKNMLRVTLGNDGFFQEAHVKLKPVDFATDGIYLAGTARSPKSLKESVEEALGTAMRASIPMKRGFIQTDGLVASIDAEKCIGCELCSISCAYGATEPVLVEGIESGKHYFRVLDALCKSCGTCAAGCPELAITMPSFTDQQLESQVDAALAEEPSKKQVAFACHWCALGAADLAGVSRLQYPPNVRIIRVMCSGRVDPAFVMRAFKRGAPGVLVMGCEVPTCHYISGNIYAQFRMEFVGKLMAIVGLERERLKVEWLSAAQGDKFAKTVTAFNESTETLGPIPEKLLSSIDMAAAAACAESHRLRLLLGKLPELLELGNRYGEQFSRHELNRILTEAVNDEFIIQKILLHLTNNKMSVKQLAEVAGIAPAKAFRSILDLVKRGLVVRDGMVGTSPVYSVIVSDEPEGTPQPEQKPSEGGVEPAARA
jgi:heterodisulfide reductase subunit A